MAMRCAAEHRRGVLRVTRGGNARSGRKWRKACAAFRVLFRSERRLAERGAEEQFQLRPLAKGWSSTQG
jgi:hypothetical protein